jgi:hypothetical protein
MSELPELVNLDNARVRQLYPPGTESAVTTIFPDPKDSQRFYAVGFDVKAGKVRFFVTGATSTTLEPLKAQLKEEVPQAMSKPSGLIIQGGHMLPNVYVPIPDPPRPGI